MKIAIKNFLTTLRRYKVASVLNIAGMTLAFLAFYVIMSQVYYNITYNRSMVLPRGRSGCGPMWSVRVPYAIKDWGRSMCG